MSLLLLFRPSSAAPVATVTAQRSTFFEHTAAEFREHTASTFEE